MSPRPESAHVYILNRHNEKTYSISSPLTQTFNTKQECIDYVKEKDPEWFEIIWDILYFDKLYNCKRGVFMKK